MSVSVIIPYKEDRGYLREAIESVEAQTVQCELILSQSDGNVSVNLNKGIRRCTTEFWAYLSEDDILPNDSIEKRLQAIGDYDFTHSNGIYMSKNRRKTYKPDKTDLSLSDLLSKNHIFGGTCLYRTEWRDRVQWDESLWTGEEFDYHLNLLAKGAKIGYTDCDAYIYRIHDKQKSSRKDADRFIRRIRAIKQIRAKYDNGQPSND